MRTLVFTLFLITRYGSITAQSVNEKSETLIEYTNDNTVSMGMDGTVIIDKYFALKIPAKLQNRSFLGTNTFRQVLEFEGQAKIVLLYIPAADSSSTFCLASLSYKKFIRLCEQENLVEDLTEIELDRWRFFGVNKLEKGSFYAIYLNVKKNQLKLYNYSISSLHF